MEKTEKSMAEMQVDLNLSYEFSRVTESGSQLVPVHGPGATGLINLGNSCYMNSVLQVLFTLPELQQRYASEAAAAALFRSAPVDAENDVLTQLAKVCVYAIHCMAMFECRGVAVCQSPRRDIQCTHPCQDRSSFA